MNNQKENIELILGRVAVICFFIFAFFALFTPNNSNQESIDKVAAIEQLSEIDHFAIPVNPVNFPSPNIKLIFGKQIPVDLFDIGSFKIICLNKDVKHLLRLNKKRFQKIKSARSNPEEFHIRSSVSNEEPPSIS